MHFSLKMPICVSGAPFAHFLQCTASRLTVSPTAPLSWTSPLPVPVECLLSIASSHCDCRPLQTFQELSSKFCVLNLSACGIMITTLFSLRWRLYTRCRRAALLGALLVGHIWLLTRTVTCLNPLFFGKSFLKF